ncbi:prokaryotic phospholipase A2-domain-containing protein [Staphylotrichum tortipilum]|uniref:Prokaryotic phospholipase A2-domain-containing protein n=1 Tax=Staphylotrichum tortipilum TaxID=2831512 RepID=A0AAN6MIJ5_9PEZI|nr:prokaryotic phospholipase A2-domain-containing protein [Staphylotrichum longicolle]
MKFLASVLCLAAAVLALPAPAEVVTELVQRQTANQITDQYLFSITLPTFTVHRNSRDPPTLIWDSDGCSSSPDNPFGFPFTPACHRHDFGYRNYKKQNRFTDAGKASIDSNFKTDLYYQCRNVGARGVCEALADVYYAAVRAFGGSSQGKRDDDLVREYHEKLAIYNRLVAEAQATGELWRLD